jgi:hypothetical protein
LRRVIQRAEVAVFQYEARSRAPAQQPGEHRQVQAVEPYAREDLPTLPYKSGISARQTVKVIEHELAAEETASAYAHPGVWPAGCVDVSNGAE